MRLLLIIVLLAVTTGSFAQTLVIKAGINLSFMKVENNYSSALHPRNTSYDMKTGFNAGLTSEFPVNKKISITFGILLSTKGYYFTDTDWFGQRIGFINKSTGTFNFIYLDVPLEGKVYLTKGTAKTYAAFGPCLGVGLGGKTEIVQNYGGSISSYSAKIDYEGMNRFDFGLIAEAGIDINYFQFSLSYNYGLVNISTDNNFTLKNRVLGISLGLKFGK